MVSSSISLRPAVLINEQMPIKMISDEIVWYWTPTNGSIIRCIRQIIIDWAPNMCAICLSLNITFSFPASCVYSFVLHYIAQLLERRIAVAHYFIISLIYSSSFFFPSFALHLYFFPIFVVWRFGRATSGESASIWPLPVMRLCLFWQTIKMILLNNRLVDVH